MVVLLDRSVRQGFGFGRLQRLKLYLHATMVQLLQYMYDGDLDTVPFLT